MRVVMALALVTDVAGQRIEVLGAEGLRPVPVLPGKTVGQESMVVDVTGATALHLAHEIRELDRRRDANHGVNVVGGTPGNVKDADNDPAVCAWRERMQTDEAKRTFRARASLCELSNAHLKHHHGVSQLLVRGLEKVTSVALLAGPAANLLQHAAKLLALARCRRTASVPLAPCMHVITPLSEPAPGGL